MATALNVFIGILVLVVAVWVAIFGGVGALLSRSRGAAGLTGFAFGTLLGPFGWLAIFWVTRGSARRIEAPAPVAEPSWTTAADPWDD